MKHNLIIVEGPDCVGKTTLAKYLSKQLGGIYVKCNAAMRGDLAPAHFDNVLDCAQFNIRNGHIIIVDRHWPSEYLYGPIFHRREIDPKYWDDRVKKIGGLYVLCTRSGVDRVFKQEHTSGDHVYSDEEFRRIVEAYDEFRDQMNDRDDAIVYNYDAMSAQLNLMASMIQDM